MPAADPRLPVVVDQVRRRRPVDDRERRSQATVLTELDRLGAPFDRAAGPVHLTGSGIVTGPRGVVLLLHRRLGIWVQPGGHLEPGEQPWDAARRESMEETGLRLVLTGAAPKRDPGVTPSRDPRAAPSRLGAGPGPGCEPPALLHLDVHPAGDHVHLDLRYGLEVVGDDEPRPPAGESPHVRWMDWDEAVATADPGLAGLLASMAAG